MRNYLFYFLDHLLLQGEFVVPSTKPPKLFLNLKISKFTSKYNVCTCMCIPQLGRRLEQQYLK